MILEIELDDEEYKRVEDDIFYIEIMLKRDFDKFPSAIDRPRKTEADEEVIKENWP